jgi:HSP20 family protein
VIACFPNSTGEFRREVRDHDDVGIVVADLPGIDKENVTFSLLNPRVPEISCERMNEREDTREEYYRQ